MNPVLLKFHWESLIYSQSVLPKLLLEYLFVKKKKLYSKFTANKESRSSGFIIEFFFLLCTF